MANNPFKRIESVFADADPETRLKVPRLEVILVAIFIIIPVSLVPSALAGYWPIVALEACCLLACAVSFLLLVRGRYAVAADIVTLVGALALSAMPFFFEPTHAALRASAFFGLVAVVLAAVISKRKRLGIVFLVVNPVIVLVMGFRAVVPSPDWTTVEKVVEIGSFLLLNSFGTLLVHQIQSIASRVLEEALRERAKALASAAELSSLIGAVVPVLERGDALAQSVRDSKSEVVAIRAAMAELGKAVVSYEEAIGAMVRTSGTIHDRIESLRARVLGQASAVEQSSAAMEEMSASISNVASISRDKVGTAKKLLEDLRTVSDRAISSRDSLDAATKTLDSIREFSGVIDQIAERTNTLAMNAAIEAAHAGEAGRGFAVVAEEIRKMSDESTENATSIDEGTKHAAEAIGTALEESARTGDYLEDIAGEIGHTVDAFDEIVLTTGQLAQAGGEILEAIAEVNQATVAVKDDTGAISDAQEGLEAAQRSLRDISRILVETAAGVDSKLRKIGSVMDTLSSLENELVSAAREVRGALNGKSR